MIQGNYAEYDKAYQLLFQGKLMGTYIISAGLKMLQLLFSGMRSVNGLTNK